MTQNGQAPAVQQQPEPVPYGLEVVHIMKVSTEQVRPENQILILDTNTDNGNANQKMGSLTPLSQTERNAKPNADGKGIENDIQHLADRWSQESTNVNAVEIDKTSNIDRMYTDKSHLPAYDPENKPIQTETVAKPETQHQIVEPAPEKVPSEPTDLRKPKPAVVPKLDTNELLHGHPDQPTPQLRRQSSVKTRTSHPQKSSGKKDVASGRNSLASSQSPDQQSLNQGIMKQMDSRQAQRQKIRRQLGKKSKTDFGSLVD